MDEGKKKRGRADGAEKLKPEMHPVAGKWSKRMAR